MKLSIFAVLFLFATMLTNCTKQKEIKYVYDPKGLLIFLDDGETDIGALSANLLTALYQNAGPIIVSASLLKNIFPTYEIPFKQESAKDLFLKFKELKSRQDEAAVTEKKYIFLKALSFDSKQWLFKKINDALYLLMPYAYLSKENIDTNAAEKYDLTKISDIELILGLKINHMQTTNLREVINNPIQKYVYADYFIKALYDKDTNTSSIFCIRSNYKNKNVKLPLWSIFINGHGYIQQMIVNLRLKDFRETFLTFLENHLNTRLLIYESCYAAGLNNEIIYKDAKSAINRTYSFAIITQALTDALVMTLGANIIWTPEGLRLLAIENFAQFLIMVKSPIINYQATIKTLIPLTPAVVRTTTKQPWGTVPQIKLPGIEWFSVMASHEEIVSIGSNLAKGRDPQKPLDVVRFFKTDPRGLLLYARDIPFELIINSNNLEAIISMIPGEAFHRIKRITSAVKNDDDLLYCFMAAQIGAQKVFFIEKMNDMNNIIVYNNKTGDVLRGIPDKYENYAFFEKDGIVYVQDFGKSMRKLEDAVLKKQYSTLLYKAQKEMPPLETATINIENLKKVIAEKIKKGPLEFKEEQQRVAPENEMLKKTLEELQASLKQLNYVFEKQIVL